MDAGLGLSVGLGLVDESVSIDESVVVGLPQELPVAQAVALSDSSHVFIYGEFRGSSIDLYARLTAADGQPGRPAQFLRSIDVSEIESLSFDAVGLDNERFVITWREPQGLKAQIFDQNLIAISDVVAVDEFENDSGGISSDPDEFLDVFQLNNGDIVFGYQNPDNGTFELQGRNSDLNSATTLQWNRPIEVGEFDFEIEQLQDSLQLSWLQQDAQDPTLWSVEKLFVENNSAVDFESFSVGSFQQGPEVEFQDSGEAIVAGVQLYQGDLVTVVETYAQTGERTNRFVSQANELLIDGSDQLVVGPNGQYSVLLVNQNDGLPQTLLTTFNRDGQQIGISQQLNQSDVSLATHGTLAALDNGGFATYWAAMDQDGQSSTLFSRTLGYDQTGLTLRLIDSCDTVEDQEDYFLQISGIPQDAGLNVGQRVSENVWLVPLSEIDQVRLLTFGQRPVTNLTFELLAPSQDDALFDFSIVFGSDGDDQIVGTGDLNAVLASSGFDQLALDGEISDYQADEVATSVYRLSSEQGAIDFVFAEVEEIQIDGQTLELQEFLDLLNSVPDDEPDNSADEGAETEPEESEPEEMEPEEPEPEEMDPMMDEPRDEEPEPVEDEMPENPISVFPVVSSSNAPNSSASSPVTAATSLTVSSSENEASNDSSDSDSSDSENNVVVDPGESKEDSSDDDVESGKQAPTAKSTSKNETTANNAAATAAAVNNPEERQFRDGQTETPTEDEIAAGQESGQTENAWSSKNRPTLLANMVQPEFDQRSFAAAMDVVEQELESDSFHSEIMVGAGVVVAVGFSISHMTLLVRSGALLTKFMSSVPIWVSFDPLPLLNAVGPLDGQKTSESLLDIVNTEK